MSNKCKNCLEPTLKTYFCCSQCRMEWRDNRYESIEEELDEVYAKNRLLTKDLYASVDKRMKCIEWLEQTSEFRDDVLIRTVLGRLRND